MEGGCVHRQMGPRQCHRHPDGRGDYRGRAVGAVSPQKCRHPVITALSIVDSEKAINLEGQSWPASIQSSRFLNSLLLLIQKLTPHTLSLLLHLLPVPIESHNVHGAAGCPSPEAGSSGWCLMVLSVCLVVSPSVLTGCSLYHLFWAPSLLVRIYRFATAPFGVCCKEQVDGGLQQPGKATGCCWTGSGEEGEGTVQVVAIMLRHWLFQGWQRVRDFK